MTLKDDKNTLTGTFNEVVSIIEKARERAYRKVNEELILMYRDIGKYISEHVESAVYGDSFVDGLADFFAKNYPDLKGFTRRGLYRMKQFYEFYKDDEKVSPLVTQLSWTHHLILMSACKSAEERLFYMALCIKERYSKRELQRQIDSGYYERYMLSQKPTTPAIAEAKRATGNVFLDTYTLDFLDLPESVSERDFSSAIVNNLKKFHFGNRQRLYIYRSGISRAGRQSRLFHRPIVLPSWALLPCSI